MKLKTKKLVVAEYPQYKKIITNFYQKVGKENILEIVKHGAGYGVPGFIYTEDTVEFFKRHRTEIMEMLNDFSENLYRTVKIFVPLRSVSFSEKEFYDAVYLNEGENKDIIQDALAWFALEEIANKFVV